MKPASFAYERPGDLAAASCLLADGAGAHMAIAGGQSLVVMMSLRLTAIETLVDISRLSDLKGHAESETHVRLGAGITHAMVEDGAVPDPSLGLMPAVATKIAYRAVRNFGTMGGSVALADPSADWPCCLMALAAEVVVSGPDGERRIPTEDFFLGPYETALSPGDIITSFHIPRLPPGSRWGTAKVARKSGAFADSLAIAVLPADSAPRLALTGTSSHPRLLPLSAEAVAAGADEAALRPVIAAEVAEIDPDADAYRRRCHLSTVLKAVRAARSQERGR